MVASFKKFNKAMKENGNDYRLAVESIKMKDFLVKTFSSVFGLGYIPVGPGTFGTFGAFILWYFFYKDLAPSLYIGVLVAIIIFSCYIASVGVA